MIWFKWEAYLTWLTGFLLLIVQFYWNAGVFLIDRSVMPLEWYDAMAISLGGLLAGWLLYDGHLPLAAGAQPGRSSPLPSFF